MANNFAEEIGVAAKKADANKEGPDKNESKSTHLTSILNEVKKIRY
jgi:hypothetical protein